MTSLVTRHREVAAQGTVALTPVADPSAFGVVVTDHEGRVTEFVEKPAPGTAPSNEINAGTYVLEPSFLDRVTPDVPVSIERVVFPAMAADGTLFAVADRSYWIDAGTASAYLQANLDAIDGTRAITLPSEVRGSTLALDLAAVSETAEVHHSVLGVRTEVCDGARVAGSVLLDGAVVGVGAVVEDSIVGPNAVVGAHATLRANCVIGEAAVVADGALLAGARVEP